MYCGPTSLKSGGAMAPRATPIAHSMEWSKAMVYDTARIRSGFKTGNFLFF